MEFKYLDIALIPLVMGLVEIAKMFNIPKKYIPIVSVLIGLFFGFGFIGKGFEPNQIREAVVAGLYIGLSASGLHSGYDAFNDK